MRRHRLTTRNVGKQEKEFHHLHFRINLFFSNYELQYYPFHITNKDETVPYSGGH